MRHIAVIGSGPAGYYTAEACAQRFGADVRIDIIDRLPVPFGLIRFGVAPDHQTIKAVTRRYEAIAEGKGVRFLGNVAVGRDVTVEELRALYDAVVIATGAPADRRLEIPGDDLPGVIGSAAFVGWYNGHPDFADLAPPLDGQTAVVVGNGNVALDVARILAKSPAEFVGTDIVAHAFEALGNAGIRRIVVLGRRGPHQIHMTPKELGELGALERARVQVDPADLPPIESDAALDAGQRKAVGHLRHYAGAADDGARPVTIDFRFFTRPVAITGDGRVERIEVERIRLDGDGAVLPTGEIETIDCGLVVACIGYRSPPIPGVPYDEPAGRFANDEGRMAPGLYCVGWARRGPTGTIGTNRPDGYRIADAIAADQPQAAGKDGGTALDAMLVARGVETVSFDDWHRIEAAEAARARDGAPREKFIAVEEMLDARDA
ncbi:FAD-dependent oxidoreductase [Sphingomonas sp. 1P06PA]|uniref:FAD-dependent oxidoreductase n=1 Tax=Sphingomonas sp. 1P06PA TaxID=554121 RepID=UPI0039A75465